MIGMLALVGSELCWAIGALFLKKLTGTVNPILAGALIALFGLIGVVPILLYFAKDVANLSTEQWLMAALRGALGVSIAGMLYAYGMSKVPFHQASLSALIYPLVATALSVLFLGEQITVKFLIAAVLFVTGFLVLVI
jgi:drug/metabolite transporter (DMT)-like permease